MHQRTIYLNRFVFCKLFIEINTFYSLICFKISKILSRFGLKVSFKPANKTEFSSPKVPVPTENRSGIYFIPCLSCNLGYIDQTRRQLKDRLNEHLHKVKNEEIYSSFIVSHCWPYIHFLIMQRLVDSLFPFSLLIRIFYHAFYILKF